MTEFMVHITRGAELFLLTDDYKNKPVSVHHGLDDVDENIALEALELLKKSVKGDGNEKQTTF